MEADDQQTIALGGPLLTPANSAGWFGKLPSVGDFVTRRLPSEFVQPWDQWLQQSIAASRSHLGESWDDTYLTFPVWRFVLPAGIVGGQGWVGVMMPSVDRVGRHFPLTLAISVPSNTLNAVSLPDLESILAHYEEVGLDGLEGQHIDQFDLRVRGLPRPTPSAAPAAQALEALWHGEAEGQWPLELPLGTDLAQTAGAKMMSFLGRRVLWWLPGLDPQGGTIRLDRWPMSARTFHALIVPA